MNKFQEYSFMFVVFILGWSSLFGNALSFILIPLTAINIYKDPNSFFGNIRKEWFYIGMPLMFCIYMLCLFLGQHYIMDYQMKASFAIFEKMLLFFFAIPLYILSMKPYISTSLLNRSILLFGGGVFFFNICLFFIQTGTGIFKTPIVTINEMYFTRFGLNKSDILGHFSLMLEPQSMTIALALFGSIFMFMTKRRVITALVSLGLFFFLSFTLTKAAIGGVILGAVFLVIYALKKIPLKNRLWMLGSICAIATLFFTFTPNGIITRINDTKEEIELIKKGEIVDGSISPRIVMWDYALNHIDEFAVFGKGVYSEDILQQWYSTLPEPVIHRANTHNSFLEYWIKGGILGLLLIVAYFAFPIIRMLRLKARSFFILGGLCIIFTTSNTSVLFIHSNSLGIIMFWLSAYYLYMREFISSEGYIKCKNSGSSC